MLNPCKKPCTPQFMCLKRSQHPIMFLLQGRLKSLRENTSFLGKGGERKAKAKGLLFGFSLALFTLLNTVESSMAWKKHIAMATRACNCLLVLKSLQLHRLFSDRAMF